MRDFGCGVSDPSAVGSRGFHSVAPQARASTLRGVELAATSLGQLQRNIGESSPMREVHPFAVSAPKRLALSPIGTLSANQLPSSFSIVGAVDDIASSTVIDRAFDGRSRNAKSPEPGFRVASPTTVPMASDFTLTFGWVYWAE